MDQIRPTLLWFVGFLSILIFTAPQVNGIESKPLNATANTQPHILIVESGTEVNFTGSISSSVSGNVTSFGWSFSRPVYDESGNAVAKKQGILSLQSRLHAEGLYNATFWITLEDDGEYNKTLFIIVTHEEDDDSPYFSPWFYSLLGTGEIIFGFGLFWATWRLKQEKIYLQEPPRPISHTSIDVPAAEGESCEDQEHHADQSQNQQ